jgi:hypothetical protein
LHFTLYVMKTSLKSAMSWKIAWRILTDFMILNFENWYLNFKNTLKLNLVANISHKVAREKEENSWWKGGNKA